MINLIKSFSYKAFHLKSFYVILIINTVIISIMFMENMYIQNLVLNNETLFDQPNITCAYNIASFFNGGLLYFLLPIFISMFFASEYKNGYSKNIYGLYHNKIKIYIAKFIVVALEVASIFVLSTLFIILLSVIFMKDLKFDFSATLFVNLGLKYLLHMADISIITLLCTLFRNSKSGILYGLLSVTFLNLIYMLFDFLMDKIFKIEVYIEEYLPYGISDSLNLEKASGNVAYTIFISLLFIIVSIFVSYFLVNKRDLK